MSEVIEIYNDAQYAVEQAARRLEAMDERMATDLAKQLDSTVYSMQRHALNMWGVKTEPICKPVAVEETTEPPKKVPAKKK